MPQTTLTGIKNILELHTSEHNPIYWLIPRKDVLTTLTQAIANEKELRALRNQHDHLLRKVAHGCTDQPCRICDKQIREYVPEYFMHRLLDQGAAIAAEIAEEHAKRLECIGEGTTGCGWRGSEDDTDSYPVFYHHTPGSLISGYTIDPDGEDTLWVCPKCGGECSHHSPAFLPGRKATTQ